MRILGQLIPETLYRLVRLMHLDCHFAAKAMFIWTGVPTCGMKRGQKLINARIVVPAQIFFRLHQLSREFAIPINLVCLLFYNNDFKESVYDL